MNIKFQKIIIFAYILTWEIIAIKIAILHKLDPWSAGDWLINYSGGFIRRGLIGEFILFIDRNFLYSVRIEYILIAIKIIIYLIIGSCIYIITSRIKKIILVLLLLSAPWALGFDLWDHPGSGRKEIIIFAVTLIFIILKKYNIKISNYSIILSILVLIHEGLYFFLPFLILAYENEKFAISNLIKKLILPTIILIISAIYIGNALQIELICNSLQQSGLDKMICSTAISDLWGRIPFRDFNYNNGHYVFYSIMLILTIIPIYVVFVKIIKDKSFAINVIICWLFTIPIFILGGDWGRWIHTNATLTILITIGNYPVKFDSKIISKYIYILFIIYNLTWYLPRCCYDDNYFINNYNRIVKFNLSEI
ncbi:hypothetical protein G6646_00225 [Polynucleobacter paneuropaeus]|nr:hypothetical protein [Polynucleobacter paneuropaeus]QWD09513.1 hypothetical protein G6713_01820 [Polynucleobacter paneuropaeus]